MSTLAGFREIRVICFMSRFLASINVESQTCILFCLKPTRAGVGSSLTSTAYSLRHLSQLPVDRLRPSLFQPLHSKSKNKDIIMMNNDQVNAQQPATANLDAIMVAQRPGPGGSTASAAVPGIVPIVAMGGDSSADELSLSLSPPGKVEPESKRFRTPPRPPLSTKRASSEQPASRAAAQRKMAQSVWPDLQASKRPKVQLDDSGWTILKLVEQLDQDRKHIKMLRETIESMHTAQLQQMTDVTNITKNADRRDLQNSKALMDMQKHIDERIRGVMEARADEPPGETLRQEQESLKKKVEQLQKFAEKHEGRDDQIASYLENLDALRPMEGQTVIQAFKFFFDDLEAVKRHVQSQAENMHEHTNNVKEYVANVKEYIANGSSKGMSASELQDYMAIQVAVTNLAADIGCMKAAHWSWEGRCHCEHVDGNTAQLLALNEQVQIPRGPGSSDTAHGAISGAPPWPLRRLLSRRRLWRPRRS